jgi:Outer membrane protein beta-barrel domain
MSARLKVLLLCLILTTLTITASAQDKKVEVSGNYAYTLAEGISVDPVILNGKTITSIGVNSGSGYSLTGDYLISENTSLGFLFSRQSSALTAKGNLGGGSNEFKLADMPIYNYEFTATYNIGEETKKVRPFIMGGLGWSQHSPGPFIAVNPGSPLNGATVSSKNTFAGTLGGGVKYWFTPSVGVKFQARWTPTYIGTTAEGIWCNFYYCYTVGNSKYSNQGEFATGLTFRF